MKKLLTKKALYLSFIVTAVVAGLIVFNYTNELLKPLSASTAQGQETTREETPITGEEPNKLLNPLNGYPLMQLPQRRPAAVIIDNQSAARPQTGLRDADLVYEFPVEGGITRFLGIYYQRLPWEIGPVRSSRPYITSLARQWQAALIHAGGSPQALSDLEDYSWHVEALDHPAFLRSERRAAPHNLYFNLSTLSDEIGNLAVGETLSKVFRWDGDAAGSNASEIKIFFTQEDSKIVYRYDEEKRDYRRFQGDAPHLDGITGQQLRVENIIIQQVDTKVIDGKGRLEINLTGEGRAFVVSRGKVVEAAWLRSSPGQPTVYADADGEKIPLLAGQTWIELVPQDTRIDIN